MTSLHVNCRVHEACKFNGLIKTEGFFQGHIRSHGKSGNISETV